MMAKKTFLITIDTEGDNLWTWRTGDPIYTENAKYVARFQNLCNRYGFKPTYLTNYEMATDDTFIDFAKAAMDDGTCEIGMHLHAWNTPPDYELQMRPVILPGENSYLIEYPEDIMDQKIAFMTDYIEKQFGVRPVSHRAGRWATNDTYFRLLNKYGYLADCSVTPGMNMKSSKGFTEGSCGSDYTSFPDKPYRIKDTGLMEIPMTVIENHMVKKDNNKRLRHRARNLYRAMKGRGPIWLRPNTSNYSEMIYIIDNAVKKKSDYVMFMLHTSEMMPGGNPTFKNEADIEKLYTDLDNLFSYASNYFEGKTLKEYVSETQGKK